MQKYWIAILTGIIGLTLTACGEGQKPATVSSKPHTSAVSGEVTETEHQKFEKKYVEVCVKTQQDDPNVLVKDDQKLGDICSCIAKEISPRLSKADAVHFLERGEFPFDLVMMTNSATNDCMTKLPPSPK